MKLVTLGLILFGLFANSGVQAADEDPPKMTMKEKMRARLAEDAKKAPAPAAPVVPAKGAPSETPTTKESTEASASKTATQTPKADGTAKTSQQPATVLPKVEVKKSRITVLDQKLAKQNEDIARERKNLKSTEIDNALNDSKIARPLSIFGGESTQFRKGVAAERIELMEAEKDMMEAIARAKTKEEKAMLQKQLDELKKIRRDLEKSMR